MLSEKKVIAKHKDIFRDFYKGTAETSCMVWGFETPPSWHPIIEELCAAWEDFSWTRGRTKKPQLVADQVKEKFGGLRFYYHMEFDEPFDDDAAIWYEHIFDGMLAYAEWRIRKQTEEFKKLDKLLKKEEENAE
jgi:hypothetical protein